MISEVRKSVQSILYERINSPLSGAFFLSWIVWNWKPVYYLIFADSVSIITRIEYVEKNYHSYGNLIIYPILSTIFLIGVYPFVSTYAYKIWLWFKTWQNKIKNDMEKNTLLTVEQSFELRAELLNQERHYDEIIRNKEDEINNLMDEKKIIEDDLMQVREEFKNYKTEKIAKKLGEEISAKKKSDPNINLGKTKRDKEYDEFKNNKQMFGLFQKVIESINGAGVLTRSLKAIDVAFFTSNDIVTKSTGLNHSFTEKGNYFVKKFLKED